MAISFHATKSFGVGEGGCVVTRDVNLAMRIARAVNFGFFGSRDCQSAKINGKLSEYHTAVGLAELDGWAEKGQALLSVAEGYRDALEGTDLLEHFLAAPQVASCYALMLCETAAHAKRLERALARDGIGFRRWYGAGLHRHSYYSGLEHKDLAVTERLAGTLVRLPTAPDLAASDIRLIAATLAAALGATVERGNVRLSAVPRIVIYGASGMSAATAHNFVHGGPRPICEVVAFIDDTRSGQGLSLLDAPVISFEEWRDSWRDRPCYVVIGDPAKRRRLVERIRSSDGHFARLYDAPELRTPGVAIGAGTGVGMPTCLNAPNITIGDHVQIMPMCSIGHDVGIEDYVSIFPGCTISGYVTIETEALIGAGTTVINGTAKRPLVIGAGARVSAGSVVTKSVPPGATVAGNPARGLREVARAHKVAGEPEGEG